MKTNATKHKPPLSGGNEAAIHAETYTDAYDRQRHCVQRHVKGMFTKQKACHHLLTLMMFQNCITYFIQRNVT